MKVTASSLSGSFTIKKPLSHLKPYLFLISQVAQLQVNLRASCCSPLFSLKISAAFRMNLQEILRGIAEEQIMSFLCQCQIT